MKIERNIVGLNKPDIKRFTPTVLAYLTSLIH